MANDKDCCKEDGQVYDGNPIADRNRRSRSLKKRSRYFGVDNPLPKQIKDSKDVQKFFRQFPFVPYAGWDRVTAHSLLQKFIDYKDISVTTGAVIEKIKTYSFGAKIEFVKSFFDEFDLGEEATEEISKETKLLFAQFISSNIVIESSYNELAENITECLQLTGSAYIEVIHTETAGQKLTRLKLHDVSECLYLATNEGEQKIIGISKRWSAGYLKRYPPVLIPVFDGTESSYKEFKDGTRRTMIHKKNGFYPWYGRPASHSCIIDQYNEVQIRTFTSKQASTAFLGNTIIEVEESDKNNTFINNARDKEAGFDSTADRFEHNFTNKGDNPSPLIITSRDYGAGGMTVHSIPPMTDAKYLKSIMEVSKENICMAFDWSQALLKEDSISGFNSSMHKDLLEVKSATKILKVQNDASDPINMAIKEAVKFQEENELLGIALKFKSPIQKIIEQKVEENQASE